MAKTTVRIKTNNLGRIAAKVPLAVGDILTKGVHDIDAHATAATPVDTGKLKNSKEVEIGNGGLENKISWSAEYAGFVNFGTRKMPAQPFASDAVEKVQPSILAALQQLEGRLD